MAAAVPVTGGGPSRYALSISFLTHRLSPTRDRIDPNSAARVGRFKRLAEVKQGVGAHHRVTGKCGIQLAMTCWR